MPKITLRLENLFEELWPPVLFFFIAFLFMGVLFKLFVARFAAVEYSAFAKAAIFALILGKVIAIVDWAESGRGPDFKHRRIVVILVQTIVYAFVVIALGIGEKIVEAYRKAHSFGAAVDQLIANTNIDHFFGMVLLISMTVFIYLSMKEIDVAMGKGALVRLFFSRPRSEARATFPGLHDS